MSRKWIFAILFLICSNYVRAEYLLIPMDRVQEDHLRAYGVAYWILAQQVEVDWLLNFRGGSFAFRSQPVFKDTMRARGVDFEVISDSRYTQILMELSSENTNKDAVKLEKTPKIAVYSPKSKQPWDDAVTLVLTYAQIPYDIIYDDEVMHDALKNYDWLHLHHEDFTGQYGKFYANYNGFQWYKDQVTENENIAKSNGFAKVSQLKLAVSKKIKDFCSNGGFLFAMCSATDSYDIALAAEGTDICDVMYDGDPMDPACQSKLDFTRTFAFENFTLELNPYVYEYSNIDVSTSRGAVSQEVDFFTLFEFSAKWDPVPTMLCQNHTTTIKGFMGQTTAFKKALIRKEVLIMGDYKPTDEARYIHGNFGRGMWTFYGGHDPEDYQHFVGEQPTDLSLHRNSPGYRLILNNILFPAAKREAPQSATFSLYPNPAVETATVYYAPLPNQRLNLEVYDAAGKMLHYAELPEKQNAYTLTTREYAAGVYLCALKDQTGKLLNTTRLLVQKP